MSIDIKKAMKTLFDKNRGSNRVFCSEADFQFALAWEIQKQDKDIAVRLEYPMKNPLGKGTIYIDIAVFCNNDEMIPIELKYKTKEFRGENEDGEFVFLKEQSAHDYGCYDFLHDAMRLEKLKKNPTSYWLGGQGRKCRVSCGYAIFLTNDPNYWNPKKENAKTSRYDDFRIYDGRKICKHTQLKWRDPDETKNINVTTDRKNGIEFNKGYTLEWETEYTLKTTPTCSFKYIIMEI